MNDESNVMNSFDHDRVVLLEALDLLHQGFKVKARVEGYFEFPDPIAGYRPDVVARSEKGRFVIVEVKKGGVDWPKLEALRRFVADKNEYELRIVEEP